MAKKTSDDGEVKPVGNKSVENILKKYGNILSTGTGLLDKKEVIFTVSPAVDIGLGGGIPEGSFVSFAGPPGCGKSSTVLQIIANVQRPEYNIGKETRKVFYLDVEHRIKPMNMRGTVGLDPDKIQFVRSTEDHILTAQDFLDIAEALVKDPANRGCLIVIDSSSALCPADEMVHETSAMIRASQPKMMAHWCRKLAAPIKVMDSTIIIIQHLITNTSGYGEKWQVDGGEKIKFQLDVKLVTKNKPEKWEEKSGLVGHVIEWEIVKSANSASGNKIKSYLRYGFGLDSLKEAIVLGTDFGIINKAGSWLSMEVNGELKKVQGEEQMYNLLETDATCKEFLLSQLKALSI